VIYDEWKGVDECEDEHGPAHPVVKNDESIMGHAGEGGNRVSLGGQNASNLVSLQSNQNDYRGL
jgi:hypothetical protein